MSGYNFEKMAEVPELTTQDLKYLSMIDGRIRGVEASILTVERLKEFKRVGRTAQIPLTQEQGDLEIARLSKARKDIVKRLSKENKVEYKDWVKASAPRDLTPDEQEALVKRMNENRDRASH